jgi:hypothetical protein
VNRLPVYVFFSVKGGVGKTALATAAAVAFGTSGHTVALLDADFTGTTIADGLALRAPSLVLANGGLRWRGPSDRLLDREETIRRRRLRGYQDDPVGLPYLDELLFGRARRFDPAAIAWSHDETPSIRWYPSSPSPADTQRAARALLGGQSFVQRLGEVVRQIAGSLGPDGVVLVDLPPGMFGFPTAFARLLSEPSDVLHRMVPVLVTTDDRNDLYRSTEEAVPLRLSFPETRWLLNRNQRAVEDVRADIRRFLGEQWGSSRIEYELKELGWSSELSRLFKEDRLQLSVPLGQRLVTLLEGP